MGLRKPINLRVINPEQNVNNAQKYLLRIKCIKKFPSCNKPSERNNEQNYKQNRKKETKWEKVNYLQNQIKNFNKYLNKF